MSEKSQTTALESLVTRVICLERENRRLLDREREIVKALGVCDGGQYLNDILGRIEALKVKSHV